MMECNEELMKIVDFDELDMGFISMYKQEEDGTKILKAHSAIFKIKEKGFVLNNGFRVNKEYEDTTRVYLGKKGKGIVFSELFSIYLFHPGTVKYCYEMQQNEIKVNEQYLAGNY